MKMFGSWSELVSLVFRKSSRQITVTPLTQTTGDSTIQIPDMANTTQAMVLTTQAQTLTNKTLTSPAITTPTGLVKGDVGLGNVDNTSDATKNSATATLTNKTLTSPVINSPTGIVKGDVGLGNVDNTSDATKNAASVTLQNKTLDNTNQASLKDTNFQIVDDGDTSKIVKFQANLLTTATTRTLTVPDADLTIVGTTTTQTLSNKTLGNTNTITVQDANFTIQDDGDATKQAKFQASGITTGNTRTFTLPDASTTVVGTDATQTLSNKTFSDAPLLKAGISVEDPGAGTNKISLTAPTLSGDYTLKLPTSIGSSGQFLQTDGTNQSTWATPSGSQTNPVQFSNYNLTTSVSSNALTIALKTAAGADPSAGDAVNIAFRNTTSATGDYTVVGATAATSLVIPSGASLGQQSGVANFFYVYAINNAGTVELAVSTKLYDETTLQNSTTISSGATSGVTIYSTTGRSSKAVRLLSRMTSTQTTAGTWAAVPSEIGLGHSFTMTIPDAMVVAVPGNGHGSTNTKVRRFSGSTTTGGTITFADSATLGSTFTVNRAGIYSVNYSDAKGGGGSEFGISLNSAQLTTAIGSITQANRLAFTDASAGQLSQVNWTGRLSTGDVIRAHTDGNPDLGTGAQFTISQIVAF